MSKKILPYLLITAISISAVFSCRKAHIVTDDSTMNYFPIKLGHWVEYQVDSITYLDTGCVQLESRCQMKYAITDTFRDTSNRLSYLMDVFFRPQEGGLWQSQRVILLTPTGLPQATTNPPAGTPQNGLLYSQDGCQFMKLEFPIYNGLTWAGNTNIDVADKALAYFKGWNYAYSNMALSYNNGFLNFDNTVTVLEDDESVNYPHIDSNVLSYRTYAKEVYALNIGMVYKEWTHWTNKAGDTTLNCVRGYSVTMKAIDHN